LSAFRIIDFSDIILNVYGVKFTILLANFTANATDCAKTARNFSRVFRLASHPRFARVGNQLYQFLGAAVYAHRAGGTFFVIYSRNSIYHIDGVKFASRYASSAAKASIRAALGSAPG
jgi:hypothetical protein